MTVNQAAMEIDWHPDKIRAWAERGEIPPASRHGDDWVISVPKLERWLHWEEVA